MIRDELQTRASEFLKRRLDQESINRLSEGAIQRFSPFDPVALEKAVRLANRYMALVDASDDENIGIEKVLEFAESQAITENLELIKYSLILFIIHHEKGSFLPIPSLEERSPEKFEVIRPQRALEDTTIDESRLAWYREDPLANSHHEHWHEVYVRTGVGPRYKIKDRHGELFFYMHQQMLARYDTERIAVGLPRVKALSDYKEKVEGYDSGLPGYSPRNAGLSFANVNRGGIIYSVEDHEIRRNRILKAIKDNYLEKADGSRLSVAEDILGATEESSIASPSATVDSEGVPRISYSSFYGNHHGFGHVLSGYMHDPIGTSPSGVMFDTATAIRDPIFYRWHKHVDDFCYEWQNSQPANDFSDAPQVLIRKSLQNTTFESSDIILSFKDTIRNSNNPDFNGFAYGEQMFGGDNWDKDFSSGAISTSKLQTMMLERPLKGQTTMIPYLEHREFFYFIRVRNLAEQPKKITVRIFLAAKSEADDRRLWIELDKFKQTLDGSERKVIFRRAEESSVINKPATKPPRPPEKPGQDPGKNYCGCGWPYNLLIPRGIKAGMSFRMMVMITDWDKDHVEGDSTCGSMSYCGARDNYPDKRRMGYPFERPFPNGQTISSTIAAYNNMAARDITIQWI